MIKTGTCLCCQCGNLFQDAYYKSGARPVGAKLFHNKIRLMQDAWEIQPFRPDGEEITPADTPHYSRVVGGEDGVPNSIYVTFGNDSNEIEMTRCCPMCLKEDTELPLDSGRYPTAVIAVVGDRTVGKSTWLNAIATGKNLEMVNRIGNYEFKLDFLRKHNTIGEVKATQPGSAGETNYLRILNSQGEIVASVILLDAAGESYHKIGEMGNPLRKFLLGHGEYKGVDGLIYMESALTQPGCDFSSRKDLEPSQTAFEVYSAMEKADALRDKPVAFVCTHLDKALEKKQTIPKIWDISGEEEVPLYTEATFRSNTSYDPQEMTLRWMLEDQIARRLNSQVLTTTTQHKRRGFMIQSCANKKLSDGSIYTDLSKTVNLMDPLLWILNALGMFPIPQE